MDMSTLLKDLECPVCLHVLTNPVVLPRCGHSLCAGCLERMTSGSKSTWTVVKCPFGCERVSTMTAEGLPKAYQFAGIIENLKTMAKASSKAECQGCGTHVAAEKILKCLSCKEALLAFHDVLLCADCIIDGHRDHDYVRAEKADEISFCSESECELKQTSTTPTSPLLPELDYVELMWSIPKSHVTTQAIGADEPVDHYAGNDRKAAFDELCRVVCSSRCKQLTVCDVSTPSISISAEQWNRFMDSLRRSVVEIVSFKHADLREINKIDFQRLLESEGTTQFRFQYCRLPSPSYLTSLKAETNCSALRIFTMNNRFMENY